MIKIVPIKIYSKSVNTIACILCLNKICNQIKISLLCIFCVVHIYQKEMYLFIHLILRSKYLCESDIFLSSVVGCFSKEVSSAVKENVKKILSHVFSSTFLLIEDSVLLSCVLILVMSRWQKWPEKN